MVSSLKPTSAISVHFSLPQRSNHLSTGTPRHGTLRNKQFYNSFRKDFLKEVPHKPIQAEITPNLTLVVGNFHAHTKR
jgi:hypothetical protein